MLHLHNRVLFQGWAHCTFSSTSSSYFFGETPIGYDGIQFIEYWEKKLLDTFLNKKIEHC